mgnify:CR=1 FL=1
MALLTIKVETGRSKKRGGLSIAGHSVERYSQEYNFAVDGRKNRRG